MKAPARLRARIYCAAYAMVFLAVLLGAPNGATVKAAGDSQGERRQPPRDHGQIRAAFTALPMRFEAATPAARDERRYTARGPGYVIALAPDAARLGLERDNAQPTFVMRLVGANPRATAAASNESGAIVNYFVGNSPASWRQHVRGFGRIEYSRVYPGIDVAYYGSQSELEYDFIAAPGADLRKIRLRFEGADRLRVNEHGGLTLGKGSLTIEQRPPIAYQEVDGRRQNVSAAYVLRRQGCVGIRIGTYDHSHALVIDPVLGFSTYLGQSDSEAATGLAVDAAGAVYITGETYGSRQDAFVAKLSADGQSLVYWTYLGGSEYDTGTGIAVDASGNALVSGFTSSPDFPVPSALQPSLRGTEDGFVAKLDAAGGLVYATYVGGKDQDIAFGVAVDAHGSTYISGVTLSSDFPLVNAAQSTFGGSPAYRSGDGSTWSPIESGLSTRWIVSIAVDPADPSAVYALTYGDGVFKSVDRGTTWAAVNAGLPNEYVNGIAFGPASGEIYLATQGGVFRSNDAGASWTCIGFDGVVTRAVAVSAGDVTTVYLAVVPTFAEVGQTDVFRSADGGETWEKTNLNDNIETFAVDPTSADVIYAGGMNGVYTSANRGETWARMPVDQVHALAVDTSYPSIVYAAGDHGVFSSVDGGVSWAATGLAGAMNAVAVVPSPTPDGVSAVYAAGYDQALAVSADRGGTWRSAGLNAPAVVALASASDGSNIYAGTITGADGFVMKLTPSGDAIVYSTLIGGAGWETATAVAVGGDGSAYLTGITYSDDFPTLHPLQATSGGWADGFVTKFTPDGHVAYSTYLGGSETEDQQQIAVDASGRAYVAGMTWSDDFPTVRASQPTLPGWHAFVSALDASGEALVYSTHLGGSGQESEPHVAVDGTGTAYVTGSTGSTDFPVRNAIQSSLKGWSDAFVTAFDPTGALVYSTYLGGSGDDAGRGIAVSASGTVYVGGRTTSVDFPTRDPLMSSRNGPGDAFITEILPREPDSVAPTSTIAPAGTAGDGGWFRSAVTVTVTATDHDGGSGVVSIQFSLNGGDFQPYTMPFTISTDGTTEVGARAKDWAGNVESPPARETVKIDRVPPALSITAPHEGSYLHADVLTVDFSASDAVSDLASGNPTAMLDGNAVTNGQTIPLLGLSLGDHVFAAAAADAAGNRNERSITFHLIATIASLKAAVTVFEQQGKIDPQVANSLVAILDDASDALGRGNVTVAQHKLNDFIDHVDAQSGKSVTIDAAQLLMQDARYVLSTL